MATPSTPSPESPNATPSPSSTGSASTTGPASTPRIPASILVPCLVAIGLAHRHLGAEAWHDEAYTLSLFATSLKAAFGDYHLPNNHIVFSATLSLWWSLLGGLGVDSVPTLRLLPLGCFVGAVGVVAAVGRRLGGPWAGLIAGLLLATSHGALNWSCGLRGYTMGLLLVSACALGLLRCLEGRTRGRVVGVVFAGTLAVGVLPTNLMGGAILGVWYLACRVLERGDTSIRHALRLADIALCASPILGLAFLVPVLDQLSGAVSGASRDAPLDTLRHWYVATLGDLWWTLPLVVVGAVTPPVREGGPRWRTPLLLAAAIAVVPPTLAPSPPARALVPMLGVWYLALGVCLTSGLGRVAALVGRASERRERFRAGACVALATLLVGLAVHREWRGTGYEDRHEPGDAPADLYDVVFVQEYRPTDVIEWVREREVAEGIVAVTDDSDAIGLRWAIAQSGEEPPTLLYSFVEEDRAWVRAAVESGRLPGPVVLLTRSPEDARAMIEELGLAPGDVRPVEDFGFFRVYRYTPARRGG